MAERDITLAHEAAEALAAAKDKDEFVNVLQTFETEPLDALYHFIGSYLEDRSRAERSELDFDNEPF